MISKVMGKNAHGNFFFFFLTEKEILTINKQTFWSKYVMLMMI